MDPVLDWTLRSALALLFGAAAVHKLRAPAAFRDALAGYGLLPAAVTGLVARGLVVAELGTAAALAAPGTRGFAPWLVLALLGIYSAAIAAGLSRGRRGIDCGCGGAASQQPLRPALLGRNAVLAAAAAGCLLPVAPRTLIWVDAITVAGATGALAAVYASANLLLAGPPAPARLGSLS